MKMLLEAEVAEILRCDRQKVKRLRLAGTLPYLPGRPVLIDEVDLLAYIDSAKQAAVAKTGKVAGSSDKATEDARQWAMKAVLFKRSSPRQKSE